MSWWSTEAPAESGSGASPWSWDELRGRPSSATEDVAPVEADEVRHRREVEEAWERGRAEGREVGEARAREDLSRAVATAEDALDALRERHEELAATMRENLATLAVAIAREIVGRALKQDPDAFTDLVRQALAAFPVDQPVRIRVHPEDLSRISAVGDGQVTPIARGREVRWVADAGLTPGGCVVDGPDRVLDGRIDQALERIFWEIVHAD